MELLDLRGFFVIAFEEWIESFDSWVLKESWQVDHDELLVGSIVNIEDFLHQKLNRLVRVKSHSNSQRSAEVEISLNDQVLLGKTQFDEVIHSFRVRFGDFFGQGSCNRLPFCLVSTAVSSIGIVSIELPETKVNFFWEVKTQVIDGFTL